MELPLRFEEDDSFVVQYRTEKYRYLIVNIDDNIVTLADMNGERGKFDVDEYEISDMMNGANRFEVRRNTY